MHFEWAGSAAKAFICNYFNTQKRSTSVVVVIVVVFK